MLKAKESSLRLYFASHFTTQAKSRVTRETLCLEDFKYDLSSSLPYYITLITHKIIRKLFKRKAQRDFYNTPTFQRKSYSSLSENSFVVSSFSPLPLLYIERRFVLKYNSHLFRVQRVFWNLGSIQDLPKKTGEVWRMQSGGIAGSE